MLYRTVHSVYHRNETATEIKGIMTYAAPEGARISVRKTKHVADIYVSFNVATDAIARDAAAELRKEATMNWAADYLGLQVKTRNGWYDV